MKYQSYISALTMPNIADALVDIIPEGQLEPTIKTFQNLIAYYENAESLDNNTFSFICHDMVEANSASNCRGALFYLAEHCMHYRIREFITQQKAAIGQ